MQSIVAFSHLRWDFVYQRPQHLLTRLAVHAPVVFIEEPVHDIGRPPWLEQIDAAPGVTVLRVHADSDAPGFHDTHLPVLRALLGPTLRAHAGAIAWLYTPMALPLVADLETSTIVYDCMDELTAFRHAPRQLAQREHALLQRADLIFTGGPSLQRAKRPLHRSVHCFPSSVDAAHFAGATSTHPDQAAIPSPRLGFYGVIDERFDAALVDQVAAANPSWQIVLVGPVAKIDPASLPQRPNVHYLGMRRYDELPALIAGWEVCLLPFVCNESTRFVSPTKVLEYMAAGKPIVSTAIRDVVDPYAGVVAIAEQPRDFIEACAAALAETPAERATRRAAMARIVAGTSWDRTADEMRALIEASAATHVHPHEGSTTAPAGATALPRSASDVVGTPLRTAAPTPIGCAIIGAGPTGLSAAYHAPDAVVFDRNATVGGWCRSIEDKGFTFDYAGHIMFSKDPVVLDLYRVLLGDNLHWQDREAWIYSHDVYTRYPFQGALYGLPPDVLKECLVGAIEARFGALDAEKPADACARVKLRQPDPKDDEALAMPANDAQANGGSMDGDDDCCGDGEMTRPTATAASATQAVVVPLTSGPRNFEEFIYRTWGAGVARHFAVPYNRKLWALPLTEMETSWLGGRVPLPDLAEMIEGAVQPAKKPVGPNARFGYPLRGGFQALMNAFLPHLEGRVECGADIVTLDVKRHRFALADGRQYAYEKLISTMPLPKLIALIGDAAPASVRQAAAGLRHVSVRCVNLGVGREDVTDKHWIYYPGDTVFHRIFVQGNTSPYCNPPGGFGLTCEITYNADTKPLPCEGEALIRRCFDDCVSVGLLRADDRLITANTVDMDYAYVIYDHARAANVQVIRDWLTHFDIVLAGRYSEWEYYNSDHAFLAGRRAALQVLGATAERVSGAA